ncbi:DUF2510 domain-containing protein [Microlunatus speluncae]|uniref:DUF2510 domain-containing protein n=1 Tax=Microlunatus speluncae TaxID=2594267 RepID=UPI001266863D|nr:DUF2510 domain-containing protein [Microlunatus speluncae]
MTTAPGWYPDPGGRAGHFRYWDGRNWSAATTTQPSAQPPMPAGSSQSGPSAPTDPAPPRRRAGLGWLLALVGVGVVVIAVVVVLAVRSLGSAGPDPDPGGQPTADLCQTASAAGPTAPPPAGERVISGRLSVMRMPPPFEAPKFDQRVPFGHDVQSQDAAVETSADGTPTWQAGVLIARLLAGDGFYGPEQGAKLVVTCILGVFYGNTVVNRNDVADQATTVDGHDAWLIESKLTFDLAGVRAKGELLIVTVVDVGEGEAGLFYASIPDTTPELVPPARKALADLRIT